MMQSAERVSRSEASDNYVYQRSLLAYRKAAGMVSGRVLEIGTGSGYGISEIAPYADEFITVDKTEPAAGTIPEGGNVVFRKMNVPPLSGIASGSMDYVISFQVIEHIRDDFAAVAEMHRVLKPGGKLIISTPNREMSLTRNPWHVREYTADEFKGLLGSRFGRVEAFGVFGNGKVMQYYEKNRRSVEKVMRLDVLHLARILPRAVLRIPYDIANRLNRLFLLHSDRELTETIAMNDYYIKAAAQDCFDLFFIATK